MIALKKGGDRRSFNWTIPAVSSFFLVSRNDLGGTEALSRAPLFQVVATRALFFQGRAIGIRVDVRARIGWGKNKKTDIR